MQAKLLENVVDKMVMVYENCNPQEDKFIVGYFAIKPEDILDFAHTSSEGEREKLEKMVMQQSEAIKEVVFGHDSKIPAKCGNVNRSDNDVSYLESIDVPVVFAGYVVDEQEAGIAFSHIMFNFILNYRAMLKKGVASNSGNSGENATPLSDYIERRERGKLAKDLRKKCEDIIGFQVSGQEQYKEELITSLRKMFSGTPCLNMANEMIEATTQVGSLSSKKEKAYDEMAKEYVGLITTSVFEDFSSAKDFKFKIDRLKEQVNSEAGQDYR